MQELPSWKFSLRKMVLSSSTVVLQVTNERYRNDGYRIWFEEEFAFIEAVHKIELGCKKLDLACFNSEEVKQKLINRLIAI